ncbi:MAG: DNA-binding transcriptional regulator [Rhodospirillaceae bacterium]|nr:DNA-binding transcriptional regulator [Rhodospirillaceae bacterium]
MTVYKEVRALTRGLDILRALNRANGATPSEVAAMTGVHRTTVRRILETLAQAGYVRKAEGEDRFLLCHKVIGLSDGYTGDAWITESAGPFLRRLVDKVVWPAELATLDGDAMVVRESTQRFSPLSIYRQMIASRWPVMTTAIGRAYLAWCGDAARAALLERLCVSPLPDNAAARCPAAIADIVGRTRAAGYAFSVQEAAERISAIALPVRHGERVLGCINIIFFASVMSVQEAAARYLPQLRDVIDGIERHLRQTAAGTGLEPRAPERPFAPAPSETPPESPCGDRPAARDWRPH